MANSPQARKRARQSVKHRLQNLGQRSEVRTIIKKVLKHISSKELDAARTAFQVALKKIDILANHQLIHANKAARLKSRLNTRLKTLATA